jgi:soluble lytic murein transglycosylase-like protein
MKKTIFLVIFIFCNIFCADDAQNNNIQPLFNIAKANDEWIEYWFDYYNLDNYIDPITNKKLTKEKIKNLGMAIVKWESNVDYNIMISEPKINSYAYGQYGLLSSTAKDMGWEGIDEKELLNPDINAKYATKFLCIKIASYNGDIIKSLAAYNAGQYRIDKCGKIKNQNYINNVYPIYVELNATSLKYKFEVIF